MTDDLRDLDIEVIGGTYPDAYLFVGSGDHCVLLADKDTPKWRNSVGLTPDNARKLAAALIRMADQSERVPSGGIAAKIERSSFGTPAAKAARATVSDQRAARVVARAKELEQGAADPDEALPSAPCRDCGPGYRIGDEGCRHDPYEPKSGETGICRTCAAPIWWETGTVGHRERIGWSDRIERGGDSLVCFKAVGYRHVPMGSREEAIYRAGFKAGEQNR